MENTSSNAERLTAACVLSIAGGFLDIYTYLCRGRVFANAVTGNMVLFGFHLSNLHWAECSRYLLAILCYAFGIFVADLIHRSLPAARRFSWHQTVILLEFLCLVPVCFIPEGKFDFLKDYCEVLYLPRTPEISTTKIKHDLENQEKADGKA